MGELSSLRRWCDFPPHRIEARLLEDPTPTAAEVFGSIFALLSLCLFAFFSFLFFHVLKQLPESKDAPRVGQKAPDFALPDQDNHAVSLTDLISSSSPGQKPGAALLIFYRGFW